MSLDERRPPPGPTDPARSWISVPARPITPLDPNRPASVIFHTLALALDAPGKAENSSAQEPKGSSG